MIIVYVVRIRDDKYDIVLYDAAGEGFPGKSADVSYNTAWEGLWAFAEITFGIIVTCTFSLPKLIEAEGSKLQGAFSNLMRPFVLFKSLGFFRNSTQSKRDSSASQDLTLDSITMMKHSDSSRPTSDRVQDVERFPDENGYEPVKYPSVDAATIPHQFWRNIAFEHSSKNPSFIKGSEDFRNCQVVIEDDMIFMWSSF